MPSLAALLADAGPVLALGLIVLLLAAVAALRLKRRARRPAPPVPPVDIPPEEIELDEGPVWACLRCGSPRVRQAQLSEGMVPGGGDGLAWVCDRCGARGLPLQFEDATAYRLFVQGLHEKGENEP